MKGTLDTYFDFEGWEKLVSTVKSNPTARPIILESWKRCNEFGLDPNNLKFKFLSEKELEQKITENSKIIEISKPYMDYISLSLTGIPHIVALSNREGWIIDYRGTPQDFGGMRTGLCLGSSWAEKDIGNNGIGTALTLNKPVLIYGIEHFGVAYSSCTCIGIPITSNGKIISAMDITVPIRYAHPLRLNILVECVSSIESVLEYMNNNSPRNPNNMSLSTVSELIATTIHDLKNPLSVISGLGQLGNITSDESKMKNYFDRIINQVDEMNGMVTELLDVFRPEELIQKNVSSIIEEVLYTYTPICNSRNINLLYKSNTNESVYLCEKLFKRTIENIINNAIQVMDKGGSIEVKTESDNDSLLILIKDTAGGIPEEIRDVLFEPFVYRRSGGTGLGLFMAYYTITNTHKGEIWFETEIGHGTTFFIKIPIANKTL